MLCYQVLEGGCSCLVGGVLLYNSYQVLEGGCSCLVGGVLLCGMLSMILRKDKQKKKV